MAISVVRIIYEDNEIKIKTLEKMPAFGIFVPLGKTFFSPIFYFDYNEITEINSCCLREAKLSLL